MIPDPKIWIFSGILLNETQTMNRISNLRDIRPLC